MFQKPIRDHWNIYEGSLSDFEIFEPNIFYSFEGNIKTVLTSRKCAILKQSYKK